MSAVASAWAWGQDLPAGEKLVLLAYADQARDDGAVQIPKVDVSRMTGAAASTVRSNVARLEDRGLVRRHEQRDGGQRVPDVVKLAVDGSVELPPDMGGGGGLPPESGAGKSKARSQTGGSARIEQTLLPSSTSGKASTAGSEEEEGARIGRDEWQGVPTQMVQDSVLLLARKRKVGGLVVLREEMAKAAVVLAEFNRQSGMDYGLGAQLTPIVERIRERPNYDADALVRLVQSAWRIQWWKRAGTRRPSPQVIFGNSRVFEEVIQDATDEKNGRQAIDEITGTARYTRED